MQVCDHHRELRPTAHEDSDELTLRERHFALPINANDFTCGGQSRTLLVALAVRAADWPRTCPRECTILSAARLERFGARALGDTRHEAPLSKATPPTRPAEAINAVATTPSVQRAPQTAGRSEAPLTSDQL